jgi:diguanylate cyclase (GGDEF)-like protein
MCWTSCGILPASKESTLNAEVDDLKILFVDDDALDIVYEKYELERNGIRFASRVAASELEVIHELAEFVPDVVLCDYTMQGFAGPRALDTLLRLRPATPVLMVSGSIDDDTANQCLKGGATDYVLKENLGRLGPAVRRAVGNARHRQALESRIDELSNYDSLTGLPNLTQAKQEIGRSFERARSRLEIAALVVLNLDQYHRVNGSFGRRVSDDMLCDIARMLEAQSQGLHPIARIGPNEFLLVLPAIGDVVQASSAVEQLLADIARPRKIAVSELRISASAGIAMYPADGVEFDDLLCKATAAMHETKATSPGGLQCHTDDAVQRGHARRGLESSLRDAVHREELDLYYQPQYDIRSGQACGVEALARWFPADGVSIAPSTFIPLAEQAGLIEPLGAWALRTATMAAAEWLDDTSYAPTAAVGTLARPPLVVCVNVSPLQICEGFTADIAKALEASGLPPDRLELEITESVLVTNIDLALKCLAQWKALGVRIALDDFGTGYSSLSYLTRLPIDRLKIDGSLIRGMTTDSRDTIIVRAVISLCREFGFTTLAEGVETDVQFAMLDDLGCEQVQGYLLARPAPLAEARELIRRRWGARPDASMQGETVKPASAWPSLKAPEGADDQFADLRTAYFTRLRGDLAHLATLRAKLGGAGTGSKTAYATIRRVAHGMAGAAAIFKAGDVMRAAVVLEQTVRAATPDADDDAVRLALDTMIDALRPICASN